MLRIKNNRIVICNKNIENKDLSKYSGQSEGSNQEKILASSSKLFLSNSNLGLSKKMSFYFSTPPKT
jgi:hypothetical protein